MNIGQTLWAVLLLLIALPSITALAQTQTEMDRNACDEYKRADVELNHVYQQVLGEYKTDRLFVEKLRNAQRAWLTYRDAQLEALYPAHDPQSAYGSVYPMCRCQALTALTLERTEVLQRWVMGVEEGDVCAGSIRIRGDTDGSLHETKPTKSK